MKIRVKKLYQLSQRLNKVIDCNFAISSADTLDVVNDLHFLLKNDADFRKRFADMAMEYRSALDERIDKQKV